MVRQEWEERTAGEWPRVYVVERVVGEGEIGLGLGLEVGDGAGAGAGDEDGTGDDVRDGSVVGFVILDMGLSEALSEQNRDDGYLLVDCNLLPG